MAASEEETASSNTFRFNDLPAELQVRIIEFAVVEDQPINITSVGKWDPEDRATPERTRRSAIRKQPNISQVSRQIRVEALKAYYKHNVFRANYCEGDAFCSLLHWLKAIGQENRTILNRLTIGEPYALGIGTRNCLRKGRPIYEGLQKLGAVFSEPEGAFYLIQVSFPDKKAGV